jgi:hypothetical protein
VSYRHLFRSAKAEKLAGYGSMLLAAYLLYGAYERRGRDQPRLLRPFSFW